MKKPLAEFIGTFAPVLFVCGATVIAGGGGAILVARSHLAVKSARLVWAA